MADRNNKVPKNVSGSYYVDDSCINCDMCRSNAPEFFTLNNEVGLTYIHRQPVTPEEIALAEEALDGCPTDSIGNDGG